MVKKMLNIDYYDIIVDDIRNCRKLNKYQLDFIKTLDDDRKHQLFYEFNKIIEYIENL
jgi:hypothetical protein